MKVTVAIASLGAAVASATSISYDAGYDDASRSMTVVSCSDGANGLITKYGWQTQGAIPNFPHVAGWEGISGWGSASCGQCLEVSYNGKTVHVLAIDHAATGVNMATAAMNELTGGNAVEFGRAEADVKEADSGLCVVAPKKRGVGFEA